MRKLLSFMLFTLVMGISSIQADSGEFRNKNLFFGKRPNRNSNATTTSLGYASATASANQLPAFAQVVFDTLSENTPDVRLKRNGSVRIPAGTWRFIYGVNLFNNGGDDTILTWLTSQNSLCLAPQPVRSSGSVQSIPAASDGNSSFQVAADFIADVRETSYIFLNYSTNGSSTLFSIPSGIFAASNPFFLEVIRLDQRVR